MIKYFKYIIVIIFSYNIISLYVLFYSPDNLKLNLWKYTPYDYKNIIKFPSNYNNLSLLNERNIEKIKFALDQNLGKNFLDIDYWNYKLFIENLIKEKNNSFESTFVNLFLLTKNNKDKNYDLKKYFLSNYNFFTEENKSIIFKNY